MYVYVRGGPEIMASPGLAVPEEPHQPLGHYKLDNSFPSTARMPFMSPPNIFIIAVIFYFERPHVCAGRKYACLSATS